jgi:hypothetical protein
MRVLTERQLAIALGPLPDTPRVVAGGNLATPWRALAVPATESSAVIWGHDASGQGEQIVAHVAHPSVRQQLREAGHSLGLRL